MIHLDHLQIIFGAIGIALLAWFVIAARKWNEDKTSPFSFTDLVIENGKTSKIAVILMGSFAMSTWLIIFYAMTGKLTEGYFGLYLTAWVAPTVAKMITNAPISSGNSSPTITTTTTETKS